MRTRAETGTGKGVEANVGARDRNEDGVETRGRTQGGNGDGSGDGNESSS